MKKKIAIIALVALASVASVFAASTYSGKARVRLGVQQRTKDGANVLTYGIADKANADLEFFLLENTKSRAGNGSLYGEVSAYGQVRLKSIEAAVDNNWKDWNALDSIKFKLGFNYANLVFDAEKNFKLGIQGMSPAKRYAQGWEVEIDNGNTIGTTPFMTYSSAFKSNNDTNDKGLYRAHAGWLPTINLSYGWFDLSLALDGGYGKTSGATKDKPNYLVMFQGNNIVVEDGIKVSGNIGIYNNEDMKKDWDDTNNSWKSIGKQTHLLYGAKLDYKKDDMSLLLGATGNLKVDGTEIFTDVDEDNAIEASLNINYNGDMKASFDAWFLDNQALWSDDDEPDYVTYENPADLGFVYRDKDGKMLGGVQGQGVNNTHLHKALSVRAKVKPLETMGITLRGQDLMNQMILGVDLPINVSDDVIVTPTFEYTGDTNKTYQGGSWKKNGETNSVIEGTLAVNYKHPLFSLYGYVKAGAEPDAEKLDANFTDSLYIRPYLDITSKKLIDGAQLRFRWTDATFNTDGDLAKKAASGKYHSGSAFGQIFCEARINF